MGIAALILGILGVVLSWIPGIGWLGVVLAVVGAILGALALKGEKKGLGIAGLVLSVIALILGLYVQIATIMAVSEATSMMEGAFKEAMDEANQGGGMDLNKMIEDAKKQAEEEAKKAQ